MKGTLIGMVSSNRKPHLPTMDDESLNGVTRKPSIESPDLSYIPQKYSGNLRDKIISHCVDNPKSTKGDIFINVSGSGTCGTIISALIRSGILIENPFDCHNCKYFTVDMTKVYKI